MINNSKIWYLLNFDLSFKILETEQGYRFVVSLDDTVLYNKLYESELEAISDLQNYISTNYPKYKEIYALEKIKD